MLNFLRNIGFTKQDILLLFFLLAVFTVGLIVRFTGIGNDLHFDYANEDLQFEQRIRSAFDGSVEEKVKIAKLNKLKDSLENVNDRHTDSPLPPVTKLNINDAYSSELIDLPGIGEVTAERIVSYREKYGAFKNISEIMNVKGIGTKKFEKLKDYITVK
jgi:comEA protein